MKLLFINSLKGLKNKRVQMLGIILLCFLSTAIYTTLNSALDMLENRYYDYIEKQNVEDFSFLPVINYKEDYSINEIKQLLNSKLRNINEEESAIINSYVFCLTTDTCNENIYYLINNIFTKYNITDEKITNKIDVVAKKYDFSYQLSTSKIIKDKQYLYKAIPYNHHNINKPYLIEGNYPINENEITVLPRFAKINNLSIGDYYKIGNNTYKIVGYMYASDHIYPIISLSTPLFDEKYNGILFMNEITYNNFNGIKEDVYVAKFNYEIDRKSRIDIEINDKGEITGPLSKMFKAEENNIMTNINTISRNIRIDALQLEFASNRTFTIYFLYILLSISAFVIAVIIKKRIEDERLQIGVLKALGYQSSYIATSYLTYPIIGSLSGGLLGFFIGTLLSKTIGKLYTSFYTLPIDNVTFNFKYLYNCVILPLIILSILSYIISLYMLRKKPLKLLKEGSNLKVNLFAKIVSKLTSKLSFKNRFKYSLASRSFGKLLIVMITSFSTGMLIIITIVGMNFFSSIVERSFNDLNFNYMVIYKMPQINIINNQDDYIMLSSFEVINIKDSLNNEKTLEKTFNININGISPKLNNVEILDNHNNNLLKLLEKDTIIINENIKEVYDINIGDIICVKYNDIKKDITVVGVNKNYYSMNAYMLKEDVNEILNLDNESYNVRYTKDEIYDQIAEKREEETNNIYGLFSINDLKRNMETTLEMSNASLYIIVIFAGIMALIIIAVVGNIVIQENKKTISLMKVMGYNNKQIKKIVLNIYTPFVVIAYLFSVPITIKLLKLILTVLVKDMEMSLPINVSLLEILGGLIIILINYYIAIGLSKKTLNKTPLAIALKRE